MKLLNFLNGAKSTLRNTVILLSLSSLQALATPPSAPSGKEWAPVVELSDEFNASQLDSNKWDDYHPNWSGRAPSAFKKGNCYIGDGNLNLKSTLRRHPSSVNNPFSDIWVDAAACASKQKSAQVGYYYEARIKASNLSMTSSFWFRVGDYSEIDVIEHIGNPSQDKRDADLPYQYHANVHFYGKHQGTSPQPKEWKMSTRGRDEYHTYGFWWKDSKTLWFYHNDVKVMEITPTHPLEENLKMIFDTEVFPFATAGVANIGLPIAEDLNDPTKNTMKVDWVRTYKLETAKVVIPPVTPPTPDKTQSIPGKVQAEDYSAERGTQTETTTDTDGGKNVGYIENGDFLEFDVNVASAGNYTIDFRLASGTNGGNIFAAINGSNFASITLSNTGGWQNWTTRSLQTYLNAGKQKVRLDFSGDNTYLLNINWINFSLASAPASSSLASSTPASSKPASSKPASSKNASSSSQASVIDQCNTTQQCKSLFGNQATDCKNSWSTQSICMCGSKSCAL